MKKRRTRTKERASLAAAMQEIKLRIDTVNKLFDSTTDEVLLDACVYELKFLRLRYAYLMRLAREEAVTVTEQQPDKGVVPIPVET